MKKYCTEEINYLVPNATSSSALIYAFNNEFEKTKYLIDILEKNQNKNGNWNYHHELNSKLNKIEEDSLHLSMIIYQLKEIKKITNINTDDIVNKSLKCLKSLKHNYWKWNWGRGMEYLITQNQSLLDEIICKGIHNNNYRIRSMNIWSLCKSQFS